VWYSTDPFKDMWGDAMNSSQPFVLSTGDPTGYALHGASRQLSWRPSDRLDLLLMLSTTRRRLLEWMGPRFLAECDRRMHCRVGGRARVRLALSLLLLCTSLTTPHRAQVQAVRLLRLRRAGQLLLADVGHRRGRHRHARQASWLQPGRELAFLFSETPSLLSS